MGLAPFPCALLLISFRADVYYDYLEQQILGQNEQWRRRVLLVRASAAYLIRHSRGLYSLPMKKCHQLIIIRRR
jgi:hypothetical protein